MPVVVAMKEILTDNSLITADAGYHSEENLKQLAAMQVEALIADNGMRSRDEEKRREKGARVGEKGRGKKGPGSHFYRSQAQLPLPR